MCRNWYWFRDGAGERWWWWWWWWWGGDRVGIKFDSRVCCGECRLQELKKVTYDDVAVWRCVLYIKCTCMYACVHIYINIHTYIHSYIPSIYKYIYRYIIHIYTYKKVHVIYIPVHHVHVWKDVWVINMYLISELIYIPVILKCCTCIFI